jgi:hypothetical protein
MEPIAVFESRLGDKVPIFYYSGEIKTLSTVSDIDAYIVSTEDGFSPLGSNRRFLSSALGIPEKEIQQLANWNRFENPRVSLVAFKSRIMDSSLRGVILAASESSASYKRFAMPNYGRPYRDFYYNVTYEAIAYASQKWGANCFAISHLSGCNSFHEDIATSNAEALLHYCNETAHSIRSFIFLRDCDIDREHLAGIGRLNFENETSQHRPISIEFEHCDGYDLVHLDWCNDATMHNLLNS